MRAVEAAVKLIHVEQRAQIGGGRPGAMAHPRDLRPLAELLLSRARNPPLLLFSHGVEIAPAALPILNPLLQLSAGTQPRHIWAAALTWPRVEEDKCTRTLGIRGREEGGHDPSLTNAKQDGTI